MRPRTRAGLAVAAVAAIAATAAVQQAAHAATVQATVTVQLSGTPRGTLAEGHLGLSFESMPRTNDGGVNSGKFDARGNLPQLLRTLGPGTLRLGGNSVDRTYARATPAALQGLVRLSDATGWRYVYSTNLAHYDAAATTADAAAVRAALGPRLRSLVCGNEPDLYAANGYRPAGWTVGAYVAEANRCLAVLRAQAPGVPVSGPDTATPGWLPAYAGAQRGAVTLLNHHHYPLSNCNGPNGSATALIAKGKRADEARLVASAAATARGAGMRLVMSEVNSAACGGIAGVSDTYASALWALDYVFAGVANGAHGMYFHGALDRACTGYTALCETAPHQYRAQPIYYGLLLARLAGTGAVLPTTVSTAGNLAAHTVRGADGRVRVVLANMSADTVRTSLRAGDRTGAGSLLRMTAPSLTATSGVRIQGRTVAADGTFTPDAATPVTCTAGTCPVTLAPYGAAVVTLPS
ncbi:glycosyl hydrolase family 79 C-terminal domain-containing protein [Spirilliplanes yamanashiensis]|uniref:Beta-glucuronidase C-terminal domain-containing protein n=1 Tax=Spirilliplanes yamanashiensis TaxID=42233 RepID=A0A8J4DKQ0_9ACTN|nr:glycosyl hydrolase family 79 C-terminal domain-containing protein [Spirilliplanes yamanashiensis]MDP9819093.1 hypothetical protein [Spirilliplanes yamanashiensis]GIJ05547.1 hypothetical protein Sya03_48990 [Spirilliplanes yamanashiensis]